MKSIRYIPSLLILHFSLCINQVIASNVDIPGIKSDNYIRTITYMNESGSLYMDQINYYDGLGRQFQTVQSQITPSFKDLVTLHTYDGYGRASEVWLPYISSENGRTIAPDYLMAQSKLQYNDTRPYARTEYELSPLERVVRVVNPGQEWSNNNRAIKTEYLLADATSNELKVASFQLTTNAKGNPLLSASFIVPFYHRMHSVSRVTDEDNTVSYEFKDAKNQTILVRNMVNGNNVDTYFVYDDAGNLCYVLPPALIDHLLTRIMTAVDFSDVQWTSDDPFIYNYAYIYEYDALNRCIAKKLPGCEWIYYVYDKADHLIFSQDGEQRKRGEWEFSIPDIFGRVVLNGLVKTINGAGITAGLFDAHVIKAEFSASGTYYGYNLKLNTSALTLGTYKVLKAAYYDNYAFRGLVGFSNSSLAYKTVGVDDFYLKRYGDDNPASGYKHKNLLTGTLTALLDDSNAMLYSCMYYDSKQRLIQTRSTNHLPGGLEEEYIAYNLQGQPTRRKHIHSATGKTTQTETYAYEYDHASRLLTTKHRLNAGAEVTLANNEYDELGHLKSNKRNGVPNLASGYSYNIRSWTKSITGTLFNQTLYYNDSYTGSTIPSYSGNISAMTWTVSGENKKRGYNFTYDHLSRLTAAGYLENDVASTNYNTGYTYDKQGNILTINRNGRTGTSTFGAIDQMIFTYNGNQLKNIAETAGVPSLSQSADFRKNASLQATEYFYDRNGNMTTDLNKGMSEISYNSLSLPTKVVISNAQGSATNTYLYSASGTKLNVNMNWGSGNRTTDYVGNMIYENGSLKRILVDGGYLENNAYHYYLTDHLGNNRVVAKADGTVVQTNHYYPFGMAFTDGNTTSNQPYKYNGKEFDGERGVNWYDYSARYMDPATIRFTTMDPLAEKYYSISPYVYCGNNPLRFVDPTGLEPQESSGGGIKSLKDWFINLFTPKVDSAPENDDIAEERRVREEIKKDKERKAEENEGKETAAGRVMSAAMGITTILIVDDATGVGTSDDIVIPLVWTAAAGVVLYDAYTSSNQPDAPSNTVDEFAHGKKKQSTGKSKSDKHDAQYTHGGKNRPENPNKKRGADERRNKGKVVN